MSEHDPSLDPPGAGRAIGPAIGARTDEADRLIAAALADHVRMPAPRRLREQLVRQHLGAPRPWRSWLAAFSLGAAAAAAVVLFVVRAPASGDAVIDEAVGDHLRIVGAQHPLDVESSDVHNVKPWFTGRLDFVPPVSFVGDDEFRLRGGELSVFLGHKAAAFVYQRRLHTISLFVFADTAARPREETTARGFHVLTWTTGGIGMALVSDVGWDDLRLLEARLRS
jgi:anti-sigma factor RsiW